MALPRHVGADRRPARTHGAGARLPGRRQPPAPSAGDACEAGGDPGRALRGPVRAGARGRGLLGGDPRDGGPVRSAGEALRALEEAIGLIRAFWSGERTIAFEGEHYRVRGLHPGPPPATHPIEIWLGVGKPRGLALTGRLAERLGALALLGDARARPRAHRADRRGRRRSGARAVRGSAASTTSRARSSTGRPRAARGTAGALGRDPDRVRDRARLRHLRLLAE